MHELKLKPLHLARVALSPTATAVPFRQCPFATRLPAASLPGSNRLWIYPKNTDPVT